MCAGGIAAQCRKNLRAKPLAKRELEFRAIGGPGIVLTRIGGRNSHPFTGTVDHLTPDTDRSPQPAGTEDSYQSNYRRSKT
jgi:hypothetical protein